MFTCFPHASDAEKSVHLLFPVFLIYPNRSTAYGIPKFIHKKSRVHVMFLYFAVFMLLLFCSVRSFVISYDMSGPFRKNY